MTTIFILLGALVLLGIGRRFFPYLLGQVIGGAIGADALSKQPDRIHLTRTASSSWKNAAKVDALSQPLLQRGFRDAGAYAVSEMPGLTVRMLAHPEDSLLAAIYEHPQAGYWVDLVTRFSDGTSATYATSKATGLKQRPGHPTINAPELTPASLYQRMKAELPRKPRVAVSEATAAKVFEDAYAESIAWRKGAGVSAREVGEVLKRAA